MTIVNHINHLVGPDDTLYHLGDWSFGGQDQIQIFRDQLVCQNIHLIYGNHDQHIRRSHKLQSYFRSCQPYLEISIDKIPITLCHYSMRVWNHSHKGAYHLYGHSHGTIASLGKSMDVGVDTNNFDPYNWEDIYKKLSNIEVIKLDHHDKDTN